MSKLYNEYIKLKNENNNKIYIFKSGMFYLALADDAIELSKIFNFKLTNLNNDVLKCGFPLSRLEFYTNLLKKLNINFQIIDNYIKVNDFESYISNNNNNNNNIYNILNYIYKLNLDEISYKEAHKILQKINVEVKDVLKGDISNG